MRISSNYFVSQLILHILS